MPLQILPSAAQWGRYLGMLCIRLRDDSQVIQPYILLNGSVGNFCLDYTPDEPDDPRSSAWSATVGHYIWVNKGTVQVHRWDQRSYQTYRLTDVETDLEKFYQYIRNDKPPSDRSILYNLIQIFRDVREDLPKGDEAIKAYLCLLATALQEMDSDNTASLILPSDFKTLYDSLQSKEELVGRIVAGETNYGINAKLRLLLRHGAGRLFQEAHYRAESSGQQSLFGGPVGVAPSKISTGSSAFFTPLFLARTIVQESLRAFERIPDTLTVFDPACGSGEFLVEALRQLALQNFNGKVKVIGWDISSIATDLASFVLNWEKVIAPFEVEIQIEHKDSLENLAWPAGVDLILMNPPFKNVSTTTPKEDDQMRRILGGEYSKRPDLSSAFLIHAADSLVKGGVMGTVLPATFYQNSSYTGLRSRLLTQINPCFIARLGDHNLFYNAFVEPGVLVGTHDAAPKETVALWTDQRPESATAALRNLRKLRVDNKSVIEEEGFSIYKRTLLSDDKGWYPVPYQAYLISDRYEHLPMVKELFDVKLGAITGHNTAFLLRPQELSMLPNEEKSLFRPAIINDSINAGCVSEAAYVFFPYDSDGNCIFSNERELADRVPIYFMRLSALKAELQGRDNGNFRDRWWELHRPRRWQAPRIPKIVTARWGGIGSFAWDEMGDFVVVQGNAWLALQPIADDVGYAYVAVLNSKYFHQLLQVKSKMISGGQFDLSTRYVEELRIPNLFSHSDHRTQLTLLGRLIASGKSVDSSQLDALVGEVFGIANVN